MTILLTLLLLGGGWLVTAGVSYAVGYASGNESGVQRLESPVLAEAQGVRVTVLGVQSTAHFTRVEILVSNGTSSSISLPLFQNAMLSGPDGTTSDADSFRSNWQPQIPPGGQRRGTLNFESQLPEDAVIASLSFVTVFVQGFDGPRSITVPNIPLRPLEIEASAAQAQQGLLATEGRERAMEQRLTRVLDKHGPAERTGRCPQLRTARPYRAP